MVAIVVFLATFGITWNYNYREFIRYYDTRWKEIMGESI